MSFNGNVLFFAFIYLLCGTVVNQRQEQIFEEEIDIFEAIANPSTSQNSINDYLQEIFLIPIYSVKKYDAYLKLGKFCIDRKQTSKAVYFLKEAIELKPDLVEAHLLLGEYIDRFSESSRQERGKHLLTALHYDNNNIKVIRI